MRVTRGTKVRTWDGHTGTVLYISPSGWYGVRIDGELGVYEWQRSQLEAVS